MYLPAKMLVAADLRTCDDGLFFPMRELSGPVEFVSSDDHGRFRLMLSGQYQWQHTSLDELRSQASGLLLPKPDIEVDYTSRFDPSRGTSEALGDLVVTNNRLCIVSRVAGDAYGDPHAQQLWQSFPGEANTSIGFKHWRVVVTLDGKRVTTFERLSDQERP